MKFHLLLDAIPTDPWEIVSSGFGIDITDTDTAGLRQLVAGGYALLVTISVIGIIVTVMLAAAKYFTSKSSQKRTEFKDEVMGKFIVAICIFGASGILNVALLFAQSFT